MRGADGFSMCRNCGRVFKLGDAPFCSDACREDYARRQIRPCAECGAVFTRASSRQICCSPECQDERNRRLRKRARRRPLARARECPICGQTFLAQHAGSHYCSPECALAADARRDRSRWADQRGRRQIIRVCVDCGAELSRDPKNRSTRCPECRKEHHRVSSRIYRAAHAVHMPRHPCVECGRLTYNHRCYVCAEKWRIRNHVSPKARATYTEAGGYI